MRQMKHLVILEPQKMYGMNRMFEPQKMEGVDLEPVRYFHDTTN